MTTSEGDSPGRWAARYQSYGLHGAHATAPGFVVLPLVGALSVVNTPGEFGVRVLAELEGRGRPGPVLARRRPARCAFLVIYDGALETVVSSCLERRGVCVGPHRSNVILPTGFGPVTKENRYWLRPPNGEPLPPLSAIVEAVVDCL
ncbi:hypothetical protein OHA40_18310 [Nocardia sp. NBC_00508]|uniref:hypothetical protein n=1 Tax=Nocardia sp. NBC_00508 TaxID=2975992 RepID=UPI002E81BDF8|nr:hypothetical protein [Nocardia sp. NBC_00508]WUD63719.1 hypothetical protein OHA40_18310 [Nocardia sp. NBC_00508]